MRLADISLNEDTGWVGHSVGHVSQHHLAAQHAGSLTVVLLAAAEERPVNQLDRRRWPDRESLHLAIVTWIERTYHRRRRQTRLGRMTPIEYEMLHQAATAA